MIIADGLEREPGNPTLLFLRATGHRRNGERAAMDTDFADMDRQLGVSLMARWERLLGGAKDDLIHIPSDIQSEDWRLITAALEYAQCGSTGDAVKLLRKARTAPGKTKAGYLTRWLGVLARSDAVRRFRKCPHGHTTNQDALWSTRLEPCPKMAVRASITACCGRC
jgi:hypothetical protein